MKLWKRAFGCCLATFTLLGPLALAQEVEPPFTWKGKGEVTFIAEYGTDLISIDFELSVGADGAVQGNASSDQGDSAIKHVFYGDRVEQVLPGYHTRKAMVVLMINEDGNEPMVAVMNGRLLAGRFYSGEVLLKQYEYGSETDKALGIGDPIATQINEDYLPASLKAALKKCMPLGMVKIEGAYAN